MQNSSNSEGQDFCPCLLIENLLNFKTLFTMYLAVKHNTLKF